MVADYFTHSTVEKEYQLPRSQKGECWFEKYKS